MAQRLLVERGDKSISKPLAALALKGDNQFARLHALWTMEGLKLLVPDKLFQLLQDPNPMIAATAGSASMRRAHRWFSRALEVI